MTSKSLVPRMRVARMWKNDSVVTHVAIVLPFAWAHNHKSASKPKGTSYPPDLMLAGGAEGYFGLQPLD